MSTTVRAGTSRRRKFLAAFAAFAVSSTVLFGGSLALLTDQDQTEAQPLVAGTVDINVEDDVMPNFNVPIEPMAAGGSFARYVNVRNKGNLATRPLTISQENGAGLIVQGDYGVLVQVDAPSQSWLSATNFAPTGATSVNVPTNRATKPYCYILDDQYVRWARVVSAAKAPRW